MKKVLFATTALVGFAGAAAADIEGSGPNMIDFVGSAEMGFKYRNVDGAASNTFGDSTVGFHSDLDMDINMSGSTGSGLNFGASIDLDEVASGLPDDTGPIAVFISGDFGTLTMGDTDGAFDKALSEIAAGGIDDEAEGDFWTGNSGLDGIYDGQVLRYDYAFSVATISLSAEIDDFGFGGTAPANTGDPVLGIGLAASSDFGGVNLGIGLGYQTVDLDVGSTAAAGTHEIYGVSLQASAGDFTLIANYSHQEAPGGGETDRYGASAEYDFGDLSAGVNFSAVDATGTAADGETYAAFATYDLGGGAEFVAAFSISQPDGGSDVTRASAGLSFAF